MAYTNRSEINISVKDGKIIAADIAPNGTCNIIIETKNKKNISVSDIIALVEVSKLSLEDVFMRHKPRTANENELKKLITVAIEQGVKDFYKPIMDPTYNSYSKEIQFELGLEPAIGFSYDWWEKESNCVNQVRNSRLGTKYEYASFLGVIIKELVCKGWDVEEAWDAVCNNSKELGHYSNSINSNHLLENTGARKIWTWFDLGNVRKILAMDERDEGFWIVGGSFKNNSKDRPLAYFELNKCFLGGNYDAVGWIVYEK